MTTGVIIHLSIPSDCVESIPVRLCVFEFTDSRWESRSRSPTLPERPYLPFGTLRAALLHTEQEHTVTDAQILATLQQLGTADLVSRAGGLDREQDWDDLLSLGERQLLAVARLLLANPPFAFLNRVDTALDSEQTALVSRLLWVSAITYIVFAGKGDGMQEL